MKELLKKSQFSSYHKKLAVKYNIEKKIWPHREMKQVKVRRYNLSWMKGHRDQYERIQELLSRTEWYKAFDHDIIQDLLRINSERKWLVVFAFVPYLIKIFAFINYIN